MLRLFIYLTSNTIPMATIIQAHSSKPLKSYCQTFFHDTMVKIRFEKRFFSEVRLILTRAGIPKPRMIIVEGKVECIWSSEVGERLLDLIS